MLSLALLSRQGFALSALGIFALLPLGGFTLQHGQTLLVASGLGGSLFAQQGGGVQLLQFEQGLKLGVAGHRLELLEAGVDVDAGDECDLAVDVGCRHACGTHGHVGDVGDALAVDAGAGILGAQLLHPFGLAAELVGGDLLVDRRFQRADQSFEPDGLGVAQGDSLGNAGPVRAVQLDAALLQPGARGDQFLAVSAGIFVALDGAQVVGHAAQLLHFVETGHQFAVLDDSGADRVGVLH